MAVAISQTANPAGVAAVSTVATYTDVPIGAAASDRIVVVCVGSEVADAAPSACTIGGVAATAGTLASFATSFSRIFYLNVPAGTTADIAVTFSTSSPSATQNHIAVYRVTGAESTLSDEGSDISGDMDATNPLTTGSTTIPTDGGFIAVVSCGTQGVGKTWANCTEDIDDDVGVFRFTTATYLTAGTAERTCTGTTDGENGALSYVIFDAAAATGNRRRRMLLGAA